MKTLQAFLEMSLIEQTLILLTFGACFVTVFVAVVMEIYRGFKEDR